MGIAIPVEVKAMLDGTNFGHLATLMPDGSPQSVPVWVGRDGERVVICTSEGSLKGKNTARDPRVALSMVGHDNPYEEAQLRGTVVERRPDPEIKVLDAMSIKYTGKPFPFRDSDQITLYIEVEKVRYEKLPFEHTPAA
jgi:PPOX class probable F420-dependent enzyme